MEESDVFKIKDDDDNDDIYSLYFYVLKIVNIHLKGVMYLYLWTLRHVE